MKVSDAKALICSNEHDVSEIPASNQFMHAIALDNTIIIWTENNIVTDARAGDPCEVK